jgi:hypothetical protein
MDAEKEIWDRKSIKECIQAIAELPDFEKMILPKGIYEEFNIPIPDFLCKNVMEYIGEHKRAYYGSRVDNYEERKPDGIIRPVAEDVLVLECKPLAELENEEKQPELEPVEETAEETEELHYSENVDLTAADLAALNVPSPMGFPGLCCLTD